MLIPHYLNPLSREKDIPLSRVLVTIGHYKNHPLFHAVPGNIPDTTPPNTPFHACGPLTHLSGGGGGAGCRLMERD